MPEVAQPAGSGDGRVESYERVVNGKVVKVNGYAQTATSTTNAAVVARKRPGRPRMAAQPGSYASGRDIPGVQARPLPQPKKESDGGPRR